MSSRAGGRAFSPSWFAETSVEQGGGRPAEGRRRSAVAVGLLVVLCTVLVAVTAREPVRANASGFVGRVGTKLVVDGRPFTFVGLNVYQAVSGNTCDGTVDVAAAVSALPRNGVLRVFAFQNFFVDRAGGFDWSPMDKAIALASEHGVRIIPVLANNGSHCDGFAKTREWYAGGHAETVGRGNVVTYDEYIRRIVQRYRNEPSIAMWQLVNEGEAVGADGTCDEAAGLAALTSFADRVGGYVHALDPNHLVSLGVSAGFNGRGTQWCGAENDNFRILMSSAGNDVCDFHDYRFADQPMGNPSPPNLLSAIDMCHSVEKPLMVGEIGIYAGSDTELPRRTELFEAKLRAQFAAGVVGELLWCYLDVRQYVSPNSDPNYAIFPGDPTLEVLSQFGE